jgi:tetratricopeptide (TPR) repeat protein
MDQRNYPEAERLFRDACRICPDLSEAHANLGAVLANQGKPAEAIPSYQRAMELSRGRDWHVAYHFGVILQRAGQLPQALDCFLLAEQLRPAYPPVHTMLGTVYLALGRLQEAQVECEQALQLNADDDNARVDLAQSQARQGRIQDALDNYQYILSRRPDTARAHAYLGMLLLQLGERQAAGEHLALAARLCPDYAATVKQLLEGPQPKP